MRGWQLSEPPFEFGYRLPPHPDPPPRGENPPNEFALCAHERGRDAFHRVPDFRQLQGRGGTHPYHPNKVQGQGASSSVAEWPVRLDLSQRGRWFSLSPRERVPRHSNALCAPEHGKDAFHRVPDFAWNEWDAVERVLTNPGGRFMGRVGVRGKRCSDKPMLNLMAVALALPRRQAELSRSLPCDFAALWL